jgi:hypothetical protein
MREQGGIAMARALRHRGGTSGPDALKQNQPKQFESLEWWKDIPPCSPPTWTAPATVSHPDNPCYQYTRCPEKQGFISTDSGTRRRGLTDDGYILLEFQIDSNRPWIRRVATLHQPLQKNRQTPGSHLLRLTMISVPAQPETA